MTKRARLVSALLAGIAIVAMVLLAAGISDVDFRSGQPFSLGRTGRTEIEWRGWAVKGDFLVTVLLALYAISLVLLPFSIIYLLISPEARKRLLVTLGNLLLWTVALYLLLRPGTSVFETVEEAQAPEGLPLGEAAPDVEFVANPSQWLVFVASFAVAVLLVAVIIGIIWFSWRQRRQAAGPLRPLAREAQDALDALRAGHDLKDTVMRCYFEMSRVLREQKGITRQQAMTPREFEQYLAEAGLPEKHVSGLTRLFEGVRYGAKATGEHDEREAIACLTAVVEACRSMS